VVFAGEIARRYYGKFLVLWPLVQSKFIRAIEL
jgi:hypothetical protein